jgi:tricorn protease
MTRFRPRGPAFLLMASWFMAVPVHALPHDPAVSRTHIAFIEGGQLWLMPRGGGIARQLTDTPGNKFTPRFSPGGDAIAFGANDAPNQINLMTMPVEGGSPLQVTFLTSHQVLNQWLGDGRLLFHTNALSFVPLEMQLHTVPAAGGLPIRLPVAYGSDGAIDATGEWLAYTPQWQNSLIANWKRYRGGAAPDIRLLNLRTGESRQITDWPGPDLHPMWDGATLYYLSDEGAGNRLNLWSYDRRTAARRQLTHFSDLDVMNPSIGPGAIVFEQGPDLHLLDLRSGRSSRLQIRPPARGHAGLRRQVDAGRFITKRHDAGGGRVLLEARGDLWLAGGGEPPRNLTATSGAFEREAAVSADGLRVAYWSDAAGEYQLYVREIAGTDAPRPLTQFSGGFRTRPVWTADSRRLAFSDQAGAIRVFDVAAGSSTQADVEPWADPTELAWSADGTWLAYTRTGSNRLTSIWRHEVATGRCRQLTADAYNGSTPVFDPGGRRMFFLSYRNFANPVSDWLQQRIVHRATGVLMAVSLQDAAFDVEGFEGRAVRLPASTGSIMALGATHDGNPIYGLVNGDGAPSIRLYDIAGSRERTLLEGTSDFELSRDGRRLIVVLDGKTMVRGLDGSNETTVRTEGMTAEIDLHAEWRQIFNDTWRLYRDYHHAPKVPLSDWGGVKQRYASMLARCVTREEVNLVLAAMIGESSTGHAYIGRPGDVASPPAGPTTGMLGADLALEDGAFRITRLHAPAAWDDTVRSPLSGTREGEYLLAADGVPFAPDRDPRQALYGKAGKEVRLTIGSHPRAVADSREITATPLATERELRRRSWVERNRQRAGAESGGRVGYVHIPDFAVSGMNDFARQYYGQVDKDALIIDARWSTGGWIGAMLAELLARRPLNQAAGRYTSEMWPAQRWGAHFGPKALIVNHITVSAGENFAFCFRKHGLGPIIGSRTWGGFTGLNPVPALIDGGSVNVPNAPFHENGVWVIEGEGLVPDKVVDWDPAQQEDPQLGEAIRQMLEAIREP